MTVKFTDIEKDFLLHIEDGLKARTTVGVPACSGVLGLLSATHSTKDVLTGKAALNHWYQRVQRRAKDPSNPDPSSLLNDVEVLFLFPWMLTTQQHEQAEQWKQDFISRKKGLLEAQVTALVPLSTSMPAASTEPKLNKKKKGIARGREGDLLWLFLFWREAKGPHTVGNF